MTRSTGARLMQRARCYKCGLPNRWGEACVMCGDVRTQSGALRPLYDLAPKLRVGHGHVCTAEGEPHKCHCGGGVTHPCNCYESPLDANVRQP